MLIAKLRVVILDTNLQLDPGFPDGLTAGDQNGQPPLLWPFATEPVTSPLVEPGVNNDKTQQPNHIERVKVKVAKVKGFIHTTQDKSISEPSKQTCGGTKEVAKQMKLV